MVEESQAQAHRSNPPIIDAALVAMAKRAMVANKEYPDKTKNWIKLAPSNCTWEKWNPT